MRLFFSTVKVDDEVYVVLMDHLSFACYIPVDRAVAVLDNIRILHRVDRLAFAAALVRVALQLGQRSGAGTGIGVPGGQTGTPSTGGSTSGGSAAGAGDAALVTFVPDTNEAMITELFLLVKVGGVVACAVSVSISSRLCASADVCVFVSMCVSVSVTMCACQFLPFPYCP